MQSIRGQEKCIDSQSLKVYVWVRACENGFESSRVLVCISS